MEEESVIYVGVGQSKNPKEAVKNAMRNVSEPVLTFVFCSPNYDPNEVYNIVKEEVGDSHIIGGTTAGEFSSAVSSPMTDSVAVMTLESPYIKVGVGVGENLSKSPYECGREAISSAYRSLKNNPLASASTSRAFMKKDNFKSLKMKPFVNIIIPDGLSRHEEEFMRGILSKTGKGVHIIGGSTGDNLKFKKTYQFANGVYSDAGVIATLSSGLKIGTAIGHPYIPTNKGALITKSDGRVIYELNNRPAADVLKELLDVDELTNDVFAQNPFGIKSVDIFGEYVLKSCIRVNDDKSLLIPSEVLEGSYLTLMKTDTKTAIEGLKQTIKNAIKDAGCPKKIGAIVLFNCILRHHLNEKYGINILDIVKEVVGDVPTIGFNTYGEQGATLGGSIGHYNQTLTVLVIGDESISK